MATLVLFSGFAQIQLEGKGALIPFNWSDSREIIYYIGSPMSKYKIIDQREEVNQVALQAIKNRGTGWSAEDFCIPSLVEVRQVQGEMTILLRDYPGELSTYPILWMGTMEGNELAANPVLWLQYADIEGGKAAFIGVVDPALSLFRESSTSLVEN